ncbi:plastidial pyruvate kinase 1 [Pyrus ussuriensis x Pyrus communis]|uniref:Plastidial pyruvate kinase 1 n=1 Tax=Pyrus ussuriensis x Pyrus communis TaxID=2448454 RepID=A0A5N5FBX5_9ROSA|nr:plastidial pyruvate kinase 1 [Pyrus ussuriensis x Pyrus communis]
MAWQGGHGLQVVRQGCWLAWGDRLRLGLHGSCAGAWAVGREGERSAWANLSVSGTWAAGMSRLIPTNYFEIFLRCTSMRFCQGFASRGDLLHEMCACSVLPKCSSCAGRILKLEQVLEIGLTINEVWYFFEIGHKEGVGQLRSCHRLFDASSKGDHEWTRDTLEWCWLLSPFRWDKGGLPLREEIKRIKDDVLALPIAAIELATNGGGKKRSSSPASEPLVEKKPRTSSAARGSSSTAEKLVIDLTSLKGVKMTIEPKPVKPVAPKVTVSIDERLAHQKSLVVPPVSRFVSKHQLGAKFGSASERLTAMKSRSTKSEAGELLEVYALLKADLLEDVDTCAKFVDSVGKVVVRSDSFVKCSTYLRRSSLIATMHKTLILAAESMRVDQDVVKCAKVVEVALLEIAREETIYLNARLSATQAMLETTEKEISHIVSKLESKEVDLQGALSTSLNLKNELDELQGAHVGLVEKIAWLKNEKVVDLLDFTFEAAFGEAAEGQAIQAEAAEDELIEALATRNGTAAKGMVVEEPVVAQATKE